MKKLLTYDDFLECSMNEIEENVIKHPDLYSYAETFTIHKIFEKIAKQFDEYETKIEQIDESLILIDKTKKIKELFNYYDNLIRDSKTN